MKIAQGSFKYISIFLLPVFLVWYYPIGTFLAVSSSIFALYLVWFFRDPNREIVLNENSIYAAADGTVLYTEESENSYKVAIRMSPFNVHLNRSPISGILVSSTRKPGKHGSVYFSGAEEKNESNLLVIQNEDFRVEVLQLTGAFARRIEVWVNPGEKIVQGQKIGMIRFGSQTNVQVKTIKSMKIKVSIGDSVKAGQTEIMEVLDAK